MIAIVVSRADHASEHIGEQLLEIADWEEHVDDSRPDAEGGGTVYRRPGFELREFDDLHVEMTDPTAAFGSVAAGEASDKTPEMVTFVSRHSGETGPLLTAHFTGNFGHAEYGGRSRDLARAAPAAQKRLVESFSAHAPERYEVGIEGTHHGPTAMSTPSLFVELGSGEAQWTDTAGARAVAQAVLDLAGTEPDLVGDDCRTRHVVGFGGGHYAPRFTRIVAETDWAVGHVGIDWQLAELGAPELNKDVLEQAFERSRAEYAVVDGDHPDLVATVKSLGYRVVGETWVREVGDLPLALVEALEESIAPVAAGLRFGDRTAAVGTDIQTDVDRDVDTDVDRDVDTDVDRDADTDAEANMLRDRFAVVDLPSELIEAAQGIDPDAVREAIEAQTVAFETAHAGTRATGRAAVVDQEDEGALVAALADVLREKYETVEVREDAVVASEKAFDPELAATLGVPEGPKFGRLASGQAVELGGRTIPPEEVRREHEETFPI